MRIHDHARQRTHIPEYTARVFLGESRLLKMSSSISEDVSMNRKIAAVAIIIAGLCTTSMNWRFSFQLGTTVFDSYIWAIFSVALDVAKWFMLPFAAISWPTHKPRASAAVAIWIVATIYSFTAAIGFAALNRDTSLSDRQAQAELSRTLQTMRLSPRCNLPPVAPMLPRRFQKTSAVPI